MEVPHEQYIAAFNGLPVTVRSYIVDGAVAPIIQDIGNRYSLHVDVIGKLEQQATYMLMGLTSPAELLGELVLGGMPADSAKLILQELNERVFMPLQKQMREAPAQEETSAQAPQETSVFIPEEPAAPLPQAPAAPTPPPPPLVPPPAVETVPAPVPAPMPRPEEGVRTMAMDVQAAQHPVPPPTYPQAPAQVLPPPPPPTPPQPFGPQPPAPVRLTPVDQPTHGTPLNKEYGTDPYREPITD